MITWVDMKHRLPALLIDGNSKFNTPLIFGLESGMLFLVFFKFVIKVCCQNYVSYGMFIIYIAAEIVLVQALATVAYRNWWLNLVGILLCVGTSGLLLISPTVWKQLKLSALDMTVKE